MSDLLNTHLAMGKLAQLTCSSLQPGLCAAPVANARFAGKSAGPILTFDPNTHLDDVPDVVAILPRRIGVQRCKV
ncbi:hypothetical protein OAN307_c44970 [Octadecabacter antarcticus 307]|uniref:Uncharacterized protein n=1 Tax=Octadecabacter antarcticus 307 TaxID=391626 RepID=M9RJ54_9RHOB|nr:hypothetical protein [Octadecabacter antarcticus]AGI69855.1 hypothetical protein OAN307_c44970 [Octadecabacter antarcticus 307]